jgi:hypothetical protein
MEEKREEEKKTGDGREKKDGRTRGTTRGQGEGKEMR